MQWWHRTPCWSFQSYPFWTYCWDWISGIHPRVFPAPGNQEDSAAFGGSCCSTNQATLSGVQSWVTQLACMCTRWIQCFSSLVSFYFDRLGTRVTLISKDRSYGCPMSLLLMECMVICVTCVNCREYLNLDQLIPAKNGCAFISYTPFTPNLSFESDISFLIKSTACGLTSASLGMTKYFLQFWILCHVSLGSSEAKGGYPTNI